MNCGADKVRVYMYAVNHLLMVKRTDLSPGYSLLYSLSRYCKPLDLFSSHFIVYVTL